MAPPSSSSSAALPIPASKLDPSSFANQDEIKTTHFHLEWDVDFATQIITGSVAHTLVALAERVERVIFDTSGLTVRSVHVDGVAAAFQHDPSAHHPVLGAPLIITLPTPAARGATVVATIAYATTPACTGAQWLAAAQTQGKTHPFLYTQCQAIHARALLPCMDTPAVRATYSATVTAPDPLLVLMSAQRGATRPADVAGRTVYAFEQPVPIASYLIAACVGNIAVRQVGPRFTIAAEPELIDAAAWEFAETEATIDAFEAIAGPNPFGNVLYILLPRSYLFGGMENPGLVVLNPSLIAGDRSNVNVQIHELAHHHAGNSAGTNTWQDFYLNEGWCVYLERAIIGELEGEKARHFHAIMGQRALRESIAHYRETNEMQFTRLIVDLSGAVDPDAAFSSVPYERGFALLMHLESLVGLAKFRQFTRAYFEHFKFKALDTVMFRAFLKDYFASDADATRALGQVDWDAWLHGEGDVPVEVPYDDSLARECHELADAYLSAAKRLAEDGAAATDVDAAPWQHFSTLQKMAFMDRLLDATDVTFPAPLLREMEATLSLRPADLGNCELAFRWYWVCLRSHDETHFGPIGTFVTTWGRMKYVRPLYRAWAAASPRGLEEARQTFVKHRDFYHSVCAKALEKDLKLV
ncbi:hypothetical protein CXG81DRAFT_25310 [Caulochytrium protostelioides]|uniref:Leukotriene A4 hydrolase n=1 Tax=Caulochytrium protostelioides TaxID=1555241 RepID=A0A4P9WUY5_9FUNG|nr:leukotriene A4 hydrolase [Caulochytrium protostelioides]RKP02016.1 hypothetical protein CXG81DRAFT_25310 [Caulochytrium protostelioides]|eukprot:RKP02016.1 hypothetical protein CXG81DRAFT_25310 [Caulochytrium protostelioides]